MALASLCGGLALANAALGAVHGFAAPLGGMLGARHGALCASLLPHVMAANLAALHARAPGSPLLPRYDEVGRLLTGRPEATAADGVEWVRELCAELRIPKLRELGTRRGGPRPGGDSGRAGEQHEGQPDRARRRRARGRAARGALAGSYGTNDAA